MRRWRCNLFSVIVFVLLLLCAPVSTLQSISFSTLHDMCLLDLLSSFHSFEKSIHFIEFLFLIAPCCWTRQTEYYDRLFWYDSCVWLFDGASINTIPLWHTFHWLACHQLPHVWTRTCSRVSDYAWNLAFMKLHLWNSCSLECQIGHWLLRMDYSL